MPSVVDCHNGAGAHAQAQVAHIYEPGQREVVVRVAVGADDCVAHLPRHGEHVLVPEHGGGAEPALRLGEPLQLAAVHLGEELVAMKEILPEFLVRHREGRLVELQVVPQLVAFGDGALEEAEAALPRLGLHATLCPVQHETRHDEERGSDPGRPQHVQDGLEVCRVVQEGHVVDGESGAALEGGDPPHDLRGEPLHGTEPWVGLEEHGHKHHAKREHQQQRAEGGMDQPGHHHDHHKCTEHHHDLGKGTWVVD
mmetsp:Transcript_57948/g.163640  ORF Transcript_57948/g.163640 Transcript_57948/m.163640 type:complete len:254 (+) Transcript_57948:259-1020(+)